MIDEADFGGLDVPLLPADLLSPVSLAQNPLRLELVLPDPLPLQQELLLLEQQQPPEPASTRVRKLKLSIPKLPPAPIKARQPQHPLAPVHRDEPEQLPLAAAAPSRVSVLQRLSVPLPQPAPANLPLPQPAPANLPLPTVPATTLKLASRADEAAGQPREGFGHRLNALTAAQPQQWFGGKQPRAGAPASVVPAQQQVQPDTEQDPLSKALAVLSHPTVQILPDRDKQELIVRAATKYIDFVFANGSDYQAPQPYVDSERVERHQGQQHRAHPYDREQDGYATGPQYMLNDGAQQWPVNTQHQRGYPPTRGHSRRRGG